jgi:phospholipase/carboxylesterase
MKYLQRTTADEVVLSPPATATASVIWLHGLGADGFDFVPIVHELGLPDDQPVRFVFPHAPVRPVTVNAGYEMRAWYDIVSFTPEGRADAAGLAEASRRVGDYIRGEVDAGVPVHRIVLAGFSQGGAVALFAGLRHRQPLAGILALSAYLPFPEQLAAEKSAANAEIPILMCHGREDPMVKLWMGTETRDLLSSQGYAVEWRDYPMQHEICIEEIVDVSRWLRARLACSGDPPQAG